MQFVSLLSHKHHNPQLGITLCTFILRLLGSIFDLSVLLVLLLNYIFEWSEFAYSRTFIDIGAVFFISGLHWVILVRQKERVQPVFILSVMTMMLLTILSLALPYLKLSYAAVPALLIYSGGYHFCCLVFHFYEKQIIVFMENAADKLSWVDPLIGSIPHTELVLRNICSFNLGLLNFIYIYISSGGAVSIITLSLIGLSLTMSVLIGLRLIKVAASVKLKTSFMLQIVKQGYSNITTIYGQLKNKQLPKATWYAWVITLMMGVTLTSPAYASHENYASTDGQSTTGINNSFSVSGSGAQPSGSGEGEAVPEGATASRARQEAQRLYEHTANRLYEKAMDAPANAIIAGGTAALGYAAGQSQQTNEQPTANLPTELEAATERATKAEADAAAARDELAAIKKSWLYKLCPACFRAPSTSNDDNNN